MNSRPTSLFAAGAVLALGLALIACGDSDTDASEPAVQTKTPAPEPQLPPEPTCDCELRSWVVLASGRHLYVDIECPEPWDHLSGRVEFTSAMLRRGYDADADTADLPRLTRMTPGVHLRPPMGVEPRDELEWEFSIPVSDAWRLQQDIAFDTPYQLIGTNSNSALRHALKSIGVELPPTILAQHTALSRFPGLRLDPGAVLPPEAWSDTGFGDGPRLIEGETPPWLEQADATP